VRERGKRGSGAKADPVVRGPRSSPEAEKLLRLHSQWERQTCLILCLVANSLQSNAIVLFAKTANSHF